MELRKRKEVPPPPAPPSKRSNASAKSKKAPPPAKDATKPAAPAAAPAPESSAPATAPPPEPAAAPLAPSTATLVEPQPDEPEDAVPPADAFAATAPPAEAPVEDGNVAETPAAAPAEPAGATAKGPPKAGDMIQLEGFGGKVMLDDGSETTFAKLVGKSGKGVVVFTYPKASTPGCTKQACLFRDAHQPLTSTSYTIYGLSRDSPKSNATFRTKQNLPYNLICDAEGTLLKAFGLAKAPKSALRGVVVVSKEGKVLGRTEGGPDATVEAARKLIEGAVGGEVKEAAKEI